MADVMELTGSNWEKEVLQSEQPVLVDFWAPWCVPCRQVAPSVEALAEELAGQMKVAKCNTDDAGDVASRYGVFSIPTLLVFKGGEVVDQIVGALPKQAIRAKLEPHLAQG
jgi:thioredoxin 1